MRYDKHWRHKKHDLDGGGDTSSKQPLFGFNKIHATSANDMAGDGDSVGAIAVKLPIHHRLYMTSAYRKSFSPI